MNSPEALIVIFAMSLAAVQAEEFVEDFSAMSSASADSNGDGAINFEDDGAELNGWSPRWGGRWVVEVSSDLQKNILTQPKGSSGPINWNTLGKEHGLDLSGAKGVEVTAEVIEVNSPCRVLVWASDEFQNGYGLEYACRDQEVRIVKLRENKSPFDRETKQEQITWSAPQGESSELGKAKLSKKLFPGEPVTVHLRIEQDAPGGPVTLTAWNTSSVGGAETSYDAPLAQVVDDGQGTEFATPAGDFGEALDLPARTYLGFSSTSTKEERVSLARVGFEVLK